MAAGLLDREIARVLLNEPSNCDDVLATGMEFYFDDVELERLLRLRSGPFGMKLFESVDEMAAIPKIRRPKAVHTTDQIVGQAARLGWRARRHQRAVRQARRPAARHSLERERLHRCGHRRGRNRRCGRCCGFWRW